MCFNTVIKLTMLKNANKIISKVEHVIMWNSKLSQKLLQFSKHQLLKFSKNRWNTNTSMILKFSMDTNGKTVRINSFKKIQKNKQTKKHPQNNNQKWSLKTLKNWISFQTSNTWIMNNKHDMSKWH